MTMVECCFVSSPGRGPERTADPEPAGPLQDARLSINKKTKKNLKWRSFSCITRKLISLIRTYRFFGGFFFPPKNLILIRCEKLDFLTQSACKYTRCLAYKWSLGDLNVNQWTRWEEEEESKTSLPSRKRRLSFLLLKIIKHSSNKSISLSWMWETTTN